MFAACISSEQERMECLQPAYPQNRRGWNVCSLHILRTGEDGMFAACISSEQERMECLQPAYPTLLHLFVSSLDQSLW